MDPRFLEMILSDDGYRRLRDNELVTPGDIVVYQDSLKEPVHVGLVMQVEADFKTASRKITVLSKWGLDGEYLHEHDYVPDVFGAPEEFWTERRLI